MPGSLTLRLPATSANLGAAFDSAAVALDFYLSLEAVAADKFSIVASGMDSKICSRLEGNLILNTYTGLLKREGKEVVPLGIRMENEIPLGMGCGSSAAGRLAAVAMASHFGKLGFSDERILFEACVLEGHPDNAAACWHGGFVTAVMDGSTVRYARVDPPKRWRPIVVFPGDPVATSSARAVLPAQYAFADVVANIQAAALLGLAFSQGRDDLLAPAMSDHIHQPYRLAMCPLLKLLMPLAGQSGILGVALSGAGPAVLLIVKDEQHKAAIETLIKDAVADEAGVVVRNAKFVNTGGLETFRMSNEQRTVS